MVPGVPKRIVVLIIFKTTASKKFCSVIPSRKIQIAMPDMAENIPAMRAISASGPGATGHGTREHNFSLTLLFIN